MIIKNFFMVVGFLTYLAIAVHTVGYWLNKFYTKTDETIAMRVATMIVYVLLIPIAPLKYLYDAVNDYLKMAKEP